MKIEGTMTTIGRVLRFLRLSRGYTLEFVAGETKTSVPYISMIEADRRAIPQDLFDKLCRVLDVPPFAVWLVRDSHRHGLPWVKRSAVGASALLMDENNANAAARAGLHSVRHLDDKKRSK